MSLPGEMATPGVLSTKGLRGGAPREQSRKHAPPRFQDPRGRAGVILAQQPQKVPALRRTEQGHGRSINAMQRAAGHGCDPALPHHASYLLCSLPVLTWRTAGAQ